MLKLKEITKYYYSESNVAVGLRNINLEFKKGEFVAITGKSGSGKSTLINVISGMDTYEEGELYFKGMETSYYDDKDWELYRKNKISFIYQSYNLIDSYTALQNVEAVLMICEKEKEKMTKEERRKKAMEALDRVGLLKQANNKATHLSSGQKQRLGIARALAKDTDVIIADEPTGNLDVENGKAIMSILHELSKEKLIIVVTHNYELAEPYATRKIRLFDGEIVEDIRRDRELYKDNDFQSDFDTSKIEEDMEMKKTYKIAKQFVKMNRFAQPHRTLFIFMFILMSAFASVIFYGYFLSNLDDVKTKDISEEVLNNRDDKRLIIRRLDGKEITEEDVSNVKDIKYVDYVDEYDGANENNYYYIEDEDFKYLYEVAFSGKFIDVELLNNDKFIKSTTCIDKEDLLKGDLPEAYNEVVLYSDDESLIGKTVRIYLRNNTWKAKYYSGKEFVVTGLLKEKTDQIYFSEKLAKEYCVDASELRVKFLYELVQTVDYTDESKEDEIIAKNRGYIMELSIGEGIADNHVRLSDAVISNLNTEGELSDDRTIYEIMNVDGIMEVGEDNNIKTTDILFDTEKGSLSQERVAEVNEKFFYEMFSDFKNTQMSVYIKDYAYTDRVMEVLGDEGYEVISALRVSTTFYNSELTGKRMTALIISAVVLVVVFFLDILVIYALMKLKRADFVILKSLGMKSRMASEMNYHELAGATITANLVAIIVLNILAYYKVIFITTIMMYFEISDYLIIIGIGILMSLISAKFYNRYLRKTFRLTSLRNS